MMTSLADNPFFRLHAGHRAGSIEEKFWAFHKANPEVYTELVRMARELRQRGRHTRLGIGMLWEVLRWRHMRVTAPGDLYALNNDYRAQYARLIMTNEPDLAGVFETRRLRSVA